MSNDQLYDPDNYLANRSPGLEPVKPNFDSLDTPPPIVTQDTSSDSSEGEGEVVVRRTKLRRRSGRRGHRGEAVLIRQLDPNRPDIARHALKYGIESASVSESDQEEDSDPESGENEMIDSQPRQYAATHAVAENRGLAEAAFKISQEFKKITGTEHNSFGISHGIPFSQHKSLQHDGHPIINGFHLSNGHPGPKTLAAPAPILARTQKPLDVRPPPRPPPISTDSITTYREHSYNEEDSIATSPALSKYTFVPTNPVPGSTLPAMQKSPPRTSKAGSPEHRETLPSLTTALSMNDSGSASFSGHSPKLTRPSPGPLQHFGPSPSSYSALSPHTGMSPPVLPTHPSYWRTSTRESSTTTPSDHASVSASTSASATTSTPSSILQSPAASYPTPTASQPDHVRQNSYDESVISSSSEGQVINGTGSATGPFMTQNFKCSTPGCTAAPFQTQYLLNSHMNVHSNTRTHFCPVKNCARGFGGLGFKRKNEMIRHGLVHTSPGYMCPFCPDQQHKYPRPDNLQRHVRVHHMDKDRDDPLLRDVLAQRPEGGHRGRRRRLGS